MYHLAHDGPEALKLKNRKTSHTSIIKDYGRYELASEVGVLEQCAQGTGRQSIGALPPVRVAEAAITFSVTSEWLDKSFR